MIEKISNQFIALNKQRAIRELQQEGSRHIVEKWLQDRIRLLEKHLRDPLFFFYRNVRPARQTRLAIGTIDTRDAICEYLERDDATSCGLMIHEPIMGLFLHPDMYSDSLKGYGTDFCTFLGQIAVAVAVKSLDTDYNSSSKWNQIDRWRELKASGIFPPGKTMVGLLCCLRERIDGSRKTYPYRPRKNKKRSDPPMFCAYGKRLSLLLTGEEHKIEDTLSSASQHVRLKLGRRFREVKNDLIDAVSQIHSGVFQ